MALDPLDPLFFAAPVPFSSTPWTPLDEPIPHRSWSGAPPFRIGFILQGLSLYFQLDDPAVNGVDIGRHAV
jgi:hypothetical protein